MNNGLSVGITLLATGPEVTVQDSGRYGYQHLGLSPAGVADLEAYARIAHQLQQHNPTVLEVLLGGLKFHTDRECTIAVAGAATQVFVNDCAIATFAPIELKPGDCVELPMQQTSRYSYVGFSPELAIPNVLGSTATHRREKIGPNNGEALCVGDRLPLAFERQNSHLQLVASHSIAENLTSVSYVNDDKIGMCYPREHSSNTASNKQVKNTGIPKGNSGEKNGISKGNNREASKNTKKQIAISFLPSPWFIQHAKTFFPSHRVSSPSQALTRNLSLFCLQQFTITQLSSAMGYRLQPSISLTHNAPALTSSGTCLGMIQLPNNGEPIVLMQERQTIGGYPTVGTVIHQDISKLAQCLPGDKVSFTPII